MQIRFFSKEGWQGNQFHFHEHLEVLLVMSEGGTLYVSNKMYPISRGSLFVLNPDDLHRSIPQPGSLYQFYSIRFYPEDAASFSSEDFDILSCFKNHEQFNHRIQLHGDQLDHLLKLINKMEYYLSVDCSAYGKTVLIKTLLAESLVYINFLYNVPPRPLPPDNTEISKLKPIFTYIQEHIAEDLSLDILSRQLFVSKYYLSRHFKEVMGFSLSEYIIKRRLSRAKQLLRQGYPVAVSGARSGFNTNAHFIRTFIRYTGVSPKQYAKQYRTLESYESPSPVHRDVFFSGPAEENTLRMEKKDSEQQQHQ